MAVAPLDADRVAADEVDLERLHVLRNARRDHPDLAGDFIDAAGAGTGQPQLARRVNAFMSTLPPNFDIKFVRPANFDRDGCLYLCH